jgi:hypothetical protein
MRKLRPESLLDTLAMRPRPVHPPAKGTSSKLTVFLIHIDGNKTYRGFFRNRLQRYITTKTESHPLHRIQDDRQRLQNLGELIAGVVGFHDHKTHRMRSAAKIALPSKDDSPLLSGLFEKIEIRIPPLIKRVVAEDPEPLCQCSQIAVRDESDIHVITQVENAAG